MRNLFLLHRRIPFAFLALLAPASLFAASKGDLSLRADPAYVSPNKDGLQDQAFFYPVIQAQESVTRWRLDIDRENKGRSARLTGAGMPALIMWDVLDKKGAVAADGNYRARMEVWGKGLHLTADAPFFIDTTPPQAGLSVSTPTLEATSLSDASVTFRPEARDSVPIERWQIQVLDNVGRTVFLSWSTGPVRAVEWNGMDRQTKTFVAKGVYRVAFEAWDMAGNGSNTAFADVAVTSTAGDRVAGGLGGISVRDTPAGQMAPLDSDNLFAYRKGRIVLSDAADAILTDLAAWINAYPDASVILEGYSTAYGDVTKDRSLGSRYAWLVYSHIVKKGGVTASRIRVDGRGRQNSERFRPGMTNPVPNGVVVWLVNGTPPAE